ncbi:MAG: hypothetical protein ACJ77A_12780 [Actinomycetota bacterium]
MDAHEIDGITGRSPGSSPSRHRRTGFLGAALAAFLVTMMVAAGTASATSGKPSLDWSRIAGSQLNDAGVSPTGAIYAVGRQDLAQGSAATVFKYTPSGDLVWSRSWTKGGGYAMAEAVAFGGGGFVYVTGFLGSPHAEGGGFLLLKYSPKGNLIWKRVSADWPTNRTEGASGVAVASGEVVISGSHFGCCGETTDDGWVKAFDARDGHPLWTNEYESPGISDTNDSAAAVAAGPGGFYVTGWVARGPESSDTDFVNHDLVVQRLSTSGAHVWTRVVSDGVRDHDGGVDVVVCGGRVLVTARVDEVLTETKYRPGHAWLRSYTVDGDSVWTREWGSTQPQRPGGLGPARDGGVVLAGTQQDPADHLANLTIRSFDSAGALQWSRVLDPDHQSLSGTGAATLDGRVFVTAVRDNALGSASTGWIARFDEP